MTKYFKLLNCKMYKYILVGVYNMVE